MSLVCISKSVDYKGRPVYVYRDTDDLPDEVYAEYCRLIDLSKDRTQNYVIRHRCSELAHRVLVSGRMPNDDELVKIYQS